MGKINKCKKCGGDPLLHINDTDRQNGYFIRWAFVRCEKCKETGCVVFNIVFDLASDTTVESAIQRWNEDN